MTSVTLDRPWLTFDLGADHRVLSWAINRPGFVTANRILWREVRNADLPPDLDVNNWIASELGSRGALDAVTFLTSRNITAFDQEIVTVGDCTAHAVVTAGLSNAERIGTRRDFSSINWGTINIAVHINTGLANHAMIEATSIIAQARTTAVIEAGFDLPTGVATGTGTDCIAIACPDGDAQYAGLHTDIGHAIGAATYAAMKRSVTEWKDSVMKRFDGYFFTLRTYSSIR